MFAEQVIGFGEKFRGRLDSLLLNGALDYVEFNEVPLAFEILCEHLCEYRIPISREEYSEAIALAKDMQLDISQGPYKHMISLICPIQSPNKSE